MYCRMLVNLSVLSTGWIPYLRREIMIKEAVLRKFAQLICWVKGLIYEELSKLGLD